MMRLARSLAAWNSSCFKEVLKEELEQLGPAQLPLQQGVSATSVALDDGFGVTVISAREEPGCIRAKVGVFFSGIVAGCSCADDPTPVEPQPEYCEVLLTIDRSTAATSVALVDD